MKLLTSGGKESLGRDAIFWHFPGYLGAGAGSWRTTPAGAIRSGDWKLQEFFEDGHIELYNLRDDLGQKSNLAAAQPDKAKELHDRLVAWRQAVKAPMPTKNTEQGQPAKAKKGKKKNAGSEE
jgi:arylsulfatase A-like enzyme